MKAKIINDEIKKFDSVPKVWNNIIGFNYLTDSELESHGFYDVVTPDVKKSEELGDIEWNESGSVFEFAKRNKVFDQTLAELKQEKLDDLKNFNHRRLQSTDWYCSRKAETGEDIPAEILTERQGFRDDYAQHKTNIQALSSKADVVNYSFE